MTYYNSVLLVGKIYSIDIIDADIAQLVLVLSNEDGDMTIPISINKHFYNLLLKYSKSNNLVSIQGFISINNFRLDIVATKITLLWNRN